MVLQPAEVALHAGEQQVPTPLVTITFWRTFSFPLSSHGLAQCICYLLPQRLSGKFVPSHGTLKISTSSKAL